MKSTSRTVQIAVFTDTPDAAEHIMRPLRSLRLSRDHHAASGELRLEGRKPVAVYTFSIDTEEPGRSANHLSLDEAERTHIRTILELFDWKLKAAAKALGINRTTLYRKMKRYGIAKGAP